MVQKLINIFNICKEELKNIITDKGVSLIMIGGIFLYGFFYMIPYHNHIARDIPIGLIDNDNSKLSQEFSRKLESNQYIHIKNRLYDLENAKEEYYKDEIKGFVVIPKDFEKDIKKDGSSFVAAYLDSAYLTVYKQLITGISEVTVSQNKLCTSKGKFNISLSAAPKNKQGAYEPISIPLYNPIGSYQNYIYPLVLIMILQQTMLIGITMLNGTIIENNEKFSKFSDNPSEIIIGKSFAHTGLYFIYAMIYLLIFPNFVIYNMTYNILAMFLILIPFLFAVSFLGQSLLFIFKTREISLLILIPSSVPFIFLPGFVWPNEAIPTLLKIFSKLIPTTSGIDGLVKVNQMGASFYQVLSDFYILIGLCVLYFVIAYYVLKKKYFCHSKERLSDEESRATLNSTLSF